MVPSRSVGVPAHPKFPSSIHPAPPMLTLSGSLRVPRAGTLRHAPIIRRTSRRSGHPPRRRSTRRRCLRVHQPSIIFIDRTVRVVHVAIDQLDAVPIKPPAPPSLGPGATYRLVAHVMEAKYCHHRPHYRTQGIFKVRHGVGIPRNTFCHWDNGRKDRELVPPAFGYFCFRRPLLSFDAQEQPGIG